MRKGSLSLLVCVIAMMACREEPSKASEGDSAAVAVADTASIPFSAPEVRRIRSDSTLDSTPVDQASEPTKPAAVGGEAVSSAATEATPEPAVVTAVSAPTAPVAAVGVHMPGPSGDYVVQIDIHKSESEALKAVQKLAARGIPAYIVPAAPDAGLSGSYWRVRVGRFPSRAGAQAYGETVLKPAGLKFWIDRKANEPALGKGQG